MQSELSQTVPRVNSGFQQILLKRTLPKNHHKLLAFSTTSTGFKQNVAPNKVSVSSCQLTPTNVQVICTAALTSQKMIHKKNKCRIHGKKTKEKLTCMEQEAQPKNTHKNNFDHPGFTEGVCHLRFQPE